MFQGLLNPGCSKEYSSSSWNTESIPKDADHRLHGILMLTYILQYYMHHVTALPGVDWPSVPALITAGHKLRGTVLLSRCPAPGSVLQLHSHFLPLLKTAKQYPRSSILSQSLMVIAYTVGPRCTYPIHICCCGRWHPWPGTCSFGHHSNGHLIFLQRAVLMVVFVNQLRSA